MKWSLIVLAFAVAACLVLAQGGFAGEDQVYDPRCPRCPGSHRPKIGGGGGPVPGYLSANLKETNLMVAQMGIPEVDEGMFIMGGKGYARIGRVIIGGGGFGGATESSGIPDNSARSVKVDLGYGGALVGICADFSRYDLTAGVLLGRGSVAVTRERSSTDISSWQDSWDLFGKDRPESIAVDDLSVTSVLAADFLAFEPFLELKVWVLPFMALDISGSYLRAKIDRGSWKMEGLKIKDSPETDLGGPCVKVGLHFGI